MNARHAHRVQPRDSMYTPGERPFNLPPANDEPANEPHDLVDWWPFLICGLVAVCTLLWGVAQGWIV